MRRPTLAALLAALALLGLGCETSLSRMRTPPSDAGTAPPADDAATPADAGTGPPSDAGTAVPPSTDAGPGILEPLDAGPPPPALGPAAARPPAPPPDHAYVITALAAERPDLLAGSCVAMGGTNDFLFEAARRLRAIDARYGLIVRGGALQQDRVAYFWGDGAPEGRTEVYVLDVIGRHCTAPGDPPATPSWLDDTAAGGSWTSAPLGGGPIDPPPVDAGTPPPAILPLPDASDVVDALAAERPDLLAASCVADGGNNEFLFELVRRLRRLDTRWGLNWKRARVGDMSQDVVDYYYGPGAPYEEAFDTYVVDVIGGHCGPTPAPAWIDVTALGTRNAMWTLAGRTDLGP